MKNVLQLGAPYPLGATFDGKGVNFALFSAAAEALTLCVFDDAGSVQIASYALHQGEAGVWHGYLPDAQAGLVYGYRVQSRFAPGEGLYGNSNKLLLDPYARAVVGAYRDHPACYAFDSAQPQLPNTEDNADYVPKAQVLDAHYDWGDDVHLRTAWGRTVVYEAHVKGLTQLHPDIPADLRGTYAGIAHPAVIAHLKKLGVTALELLPVQYFLDEPRLQKMGLVNYWGYNPLAWFAPADRYWSGREGTSPLSEFRAMVRALHAAGIEVILDVVFNHSAELDAQGPMLSLRGIDNRSYYVLNADHHYDNLTGCGNALNLAHPRVLQMVMDSLRYWVQECHVDGFRFDLAVTLGRNAQGFDVNAALWAAIQQDPILAPCKMIAEPWDIGLGGYQLGNFPAGWREWSDQSRDTLRAFWLQDGVNRAQFVRRFAASSDVFHRHGRTPSAVLNFLTAHDGFNLVDLVSYNHKHNQANGEDNRDGHSHNLSWNCGVEGPSHDPHISTLRLHVRKALLATLLLAQGTPMLLAGDELSHSQQGNNNAYCQDNQLTWLNWQTECDLSEYVAELVALRAEIPALTADQWWTGRADAQGVVDVEWLNPSSGVLEAHDWQDPAAKAMMIRLSYRWLIVLNASGHQVHFSLPAGDWNTRLSSADDGAVKEKTFVASARSVAVLQLR